MYQPALNGAQNNFKIFNLEVDSHGSSATERS